MKIMNKPHTTVVLAMTVDGKIADYKRSPARFGSGADKNHLEKQIAHADGVLFGAGTLRAYQTSLPITTPELLQWREKEGKPPQPVHIVCCASGNLNPEMRFFSQPIPRWLLTTPEGFKNWQDTNCMGFEKALISKGEQILIIKTDTPRLTNFAGESPDKKINWVEVFATLKEMGLNQLAILGGGQLVASLLEAKLLDEIWLTVCPIILGGKEAPTPVAGLGLLAQHCQELELLTIERVEQEVFLHYRLKPKLDS